MEAVNVAGTEHRFRLVGDTPGRRLAYAECGSWDCLEEQLRVNRRKGEKQCRRCFPRRRNMKRLSP